MNWFRKLVPINQEQVEAAVEKLRPKSENELRAIVRDGRSNTVEFLRLALEYDRRAHISEYHAGTGLPDDLDTEEYQTRADEAWSIFRQRYVDEGGL